MTPDSTTRSSRSVSISVVPNVDSASRNSPRGTSRSTRPMGPASTATALALGSRWTPSLWCPILTSRSPRVHLLHGPPPAPSISDVCSSRCARSTTSIPTLRSPNFRRSPRSCCSTGPAPPERSRSGTRTATGVNAPMTPGTRASSRGYSGAIPTPRAIALASRSRATCVRCPARSARGRGCGPSVLVSLSTVIRSLQSRPCRSLMPLQRWKVSNSRSAIE
ncbi:unannotated protein [freshwater metagenome]|uniref:Unannotated protein n=1 Tax=freshwater metagenome TaxID=449393 RepID=A0A6J7KPC0_9ZZZZ